MDAYITYVRQVSEARLGELRREAAEWSMSRPARARRPRLRARAAGRWERRRTASTVAPTALARPVADAGLRRSA